MINANELRIGNWVRFKHLLCFIITIKQDNCEIQSSRLVVNSSYDFIEPIPLTPEILEKCGFVYSWDGGTNEANYSVKKNGKIVFSINDSLVFRHSFYNSTKLQYLHQLQNLIFALTGEELIFKLQNK